MIGRKSFFAAKRQANGIEGQVSKSVILQELDNKSII